MKTTQKILVIAALFLCLEITGCNFGQLLHPGSNTNSSSGSAPVKCEAGKVKYVTAASNIGTVNLVNCQFSSPIVILSEKGNYHDDVETACGPNIFLGFLDQKIKRVYDSGDEYNIDEFFQADDLNATNYVNFHYDAVIQGKNNYECRADSLHSKQESDGQTIEVTNCTCTLVAKK